MRRGAYGKDDLVKLAIIQQTSTVVDEEDKDSEQ